MLADGSSEQTVCWEKVYSFVNGVIWVLLDEEIIFVHHLGFLIPTFEYQIFSAEDQAKALIFVIDMENTAIVIKSLTEKRKSKE